MKSEHRAAATRSAYRAVAAATSLFVPSSTQTLGPLLHARKLWHPWRTLSGALTIVARVGVSSCVGISFFWVQLRKGFCSCTPSCKLVMEFRGSKHQGNYSRLGLAKRGSERSLREMRHRKSEMSTSTASPTIFRECWYEVTEEKQGSLFRQVVLR